MLEAKTLKKSYGSVVAVDGVSLHADAGETVGLLIAALGKTPEATRGLAIFATLVMVMWADRGCPRG